MGILIFLVLLFLFPLGQVARINIGNGIALNPLDIGVFAIASLTLVIVMLKRKMPAWILPLGIFALLGLLGLLFNRTLSQSEFFVSLLYLVRFGAYALVGVGINFLSEKQKKGTETCLLFAGGFMLFLGFAQYFLYPSLRNLLYAGWDPHLYRMFGTFLDPNFAGVFFVLYVLLVLNNFFNNKGWKKVVLGVLSGLGVLGVLLSFSRGAYLDMGVGFLVYIFLKGYRKIAVALPIAVILLGFIFAYFVPTGEGKNLLRAASTDARLKSAENAVTIFLKNPILGVGFDSYRYAQHRYHLLNTFNWEDTHSGAGANNSFVFVLATTGILGGIAYGWFWWVVMKKRSLFFFATWIVLLVSGIFENTLFYPSIMLWMFVLLGIIG